MNDVIQAFADAAPTDASTWRTCVARLAQRVSAQSYQMWLAPLTPLDETLDALASSATAGLATVRLTLRAPNSYVQQWFELHFQAAVVAEAKALGVGLQIAFAPDAEALARAAASPAPIAIVAPVVPAAVVDANEPDDEPIDVIEPIVVEAAPLPERVASIGSASDLGAPPERATLNPRYTFDTFVAGPSNQLAFAASQAAGTTFPPKWNPLFLWGGVGLGKTHLLHAIGHEQVAARPSTRVVYLSAERFMNEYVAAVQTRQMPAFRKRYREGIDVLLVDDIQFLAGKDGTQEEFFHTFNALYDAQKQIVLTADRKPNEISDIADRLRTRFQWGLLADIEPPELEVRIAILRKKAGADGIVLPDDVANYIASHIKSNVRELEGALIRLSASASLMGRRIDLAFAREALEGALARPRDVITTEIVMRAVASYYGVKPADLKSPRRHKSIAAPRAVAMYLARQHTRDSYPDLGRAFGGKHHTTIISAVEKIDGRLPDDADLRAELAAIIQTLGQSGTARG